MGRKAATDDVKMMCLAGWAGSGEDLKWLTQDCIAAWAM